jgi:hypothetical protein
MGIFDLFKRKSPNSLEPVSLTFTKEETKAMQDKLAFYSSIGQGTLVVKPKVKEAMKAQGLMEYAECLMDTIPNEESNVFFDKAIKAAMKAYSIHNLPFYLYLISDMLGQSGDVEQAMSFMKLFLSQQANFVPDTVDSVCLQDRDVENAIATAHEILSLHGIK